MYPVVLEQVVISLKELVFVRDHAVPHTCSVSKLDPHQCSRMLMLWGSQWPSMHLRRRRERGVRNAKHRILGACATTPLYTGYLCSLWVTGADSAEISLAVWEADQGPGLSLWEHCMMSLLCEVSLPENKNSVFTGLMNHEYLLVLNHRGVLIRWSNLHFPQSKSWKCI